MYTDLECTNTVTFIVFQTAENNSQFPLLLYNSLSRPSSFLQYSESPSVQDVLGDSLPHIYSMNKNRRWFATF